MTNYVVFDLETVPDLDIARRLLNLGAEVPNEEVRVAIGQKYARPDQDPREIFLKPLFHRIVCIGAVFAERHASAACGWAASYRWGTCRRMFWNGS